VGGQKRGTQDSIIPIENDTSLTSLWLIFGLEPDFLFSELIMERIPDLLVTPRSWPEPILSSVVAGRRCCSFGPY
jgi:hypothetical protein